MLYSGIMSESRPYIIVERECEMSTQSDRISRLEGIIEAILERLSSIDNRINNRITALESRIETRFNWMFGSIFTT